ncbi:MAG: Xaa-Pro peptidase family protein [Candidatus Andeanibacterium colombiense]|uniref:Xaa-Pro peptidase family protein n=1 Tax=Candidatus Andeanibacterium colombiense TaxID=3121345 RepID=A0AAJ6BPE7_9SPHN|nr:MAG: Xaa-Pro peptidase family protein [Sphingomonadaceae bacterium]
MLNTSFSSAEYHGRVARAQSLMHTHGLDAMLLSNEKHLEYFSGYRSDLWASPTRPFYLIVPLEGDPFAVLPQGADDAWRGSSWVKRFSTWPSPRPEDEGVSEVAAELRALPSRFGRIGIEMGPESRIGMTLGDVFRLIDALRPLEIADCAILCREVRIVKSDAEIAYIRRACTAACDAFDRMDEFATAGSSEAEVANRFAAAMLAGGASKVPFVAMGSGPDGYETIILRAGPRILEPGDIFAIDTGADVHGYFCDFDRNYAICEASEEARRIYRSLQRATDAGIAAARPGNTAADLFHAQARSIEADGIVAATQGRFGHGLGITLTEWPSNAPHDNTPLLPGMVMTIEPGIAYGEGKVMVAEENVVITENGCELLSRRASPELPAISW